MTKNFGFSVDFSLRSSKYYFLILTPNNQNFNFSKFQFSISAQKGFFKMNYELLNELILFI